MPRVAPTVALVAGGALLAPAARAHERAALRPDQLLSAWELDVVIVPALLAVTALYGTGLLRLWSSSAPGRGVRRREAACFAAGLGALVIGLLSPLHPLGRVLFSAHMTQHEILMLVAAPLLVLGRPLVAFLWAIPRRWARRLGDWTRARWWRSVWAVLAAPLAAFLIHAAALWVWHLPALFQATLVSEAVHTAQHVSFLGTALLFWWALIHGGPGATRYGLAVLFLFATALHSGLLGALLTFATAPLYPAYAVTASDWGLTPLQDQQLGGLIMWVPAGLVYAGAGLALFSGWMRAAERSAKRREYGSFAVHRPLKPLAVADRQREARQ